MTTTSWVWAGALLALLASTPVPLLAQEHLAQAQALYRRDRVDSALTLALLAAEREPERAEAHFWLGRIARRKAEQAGGVARVVNARRALEGFARAVRLEPDNPDYLAAFARLLGEAPSFLGGDRDSGLAVAERLRRIDEVRGTLLVAEFLRQRGNREGARADSLVAALAQARAEDRAVSDSALAYIERRLASRGLPLSTAISLAEWARRLDESRGAMHLAAWLNRAGQSERADSVVEALGRSRSAGIEVLVFASNYFALHRTERALAFAERALNLDPDHVTARYLRACALLFLGRDLQRAREDLRWVIANNRFTGPMLVEQAAAYWRLGQVWAVLGERDSAEVALRRALELRSGFEEARRSLDSLGRRR